MAIIKFMQEDWEVVPWYGFTKEFDIVARQYGYVDGWKGFWDLEVAPWMHTNLQGKWFWGGAMEHLGPVGYYFQLKSDALLFKMIWHIDAKNPKMPAICSGKQSVL